MRDNKKENGLRVAETEIDMLCVDRNGENCLVGECKFKEVPFSYFEYLDTLAKLTPLKDKATFHYALFSESGFDEKIICDAKEKGAALYSLEDMVNLV